MTEQSGPRQPFLNNAVIALRAPTQVWSRSSGDTSSPIDGVFYGDTRHIESISLQCDQSELEWVSYTSRDSHTAVFNALLRDVDSEDADPKVRLLRTREISESYVKESYTVISHVDQPISLDLRLALSFSFTPLDQIKDGRIGNQAVELTTDNKTAKGRHGCAETLVSSTGTISAQADPNAIEIHWRLEVEPRSLITAKWTAALSDTSLAVDAASRNWPQLAATSGTTDVQRWRQRAWSDLDSLRMTLPGSSDEFLAAGAPWFFTLFGRDSLWSARLLLPFHPQLALSTLRTLSSLQGRKYDVETAEAPGKILHELRANALTIPEEDVLLPPIYYGSVDATLLWICLLGDIWKLGTYDQEISSLLPALRAALHWMIEDGDGDGDGFIDYIDQSGRGLSNQGWKDSGDSIQWRDGRLAVGPIALCEVQGYAYEAALIGADILEDYHQHPVAEDFLGAHITPRMLREWAEKLKVRFSRHYWVDTEEGNYPAIALDGSKKAVDTLTSNIGHLLGTGILAPDEEAHIAQLLTGPSMLTGFGIRTLSDQAAGYWPLSYHGGSVWAHDTAIIYWSMRRAGLNAPADLVRNDLIRAAAGFNYRMPELYSGDSLTSTPQPIPYPAACRPQAWAAAAAFAIE